MRGVSAGEEKECHRHTVQCKVIGVVTLAPPSTLRASCTDRLNPGNNGGVRNGWHGEEATATVSGERAPRSICNRFSGDDDGHYSRVISDAHGNRQSPAITSTLRCAHLATSSITPGRHRRRHLPPQPVACSPGSSSTVHATPRPPHAWQ